jgi:hypothetical protein
MDTKITQIKIKSDNKSLLYCFPNYSKLLGRGFFNNIYFDIYKFLILLHVSCEMCYFRALEHELIVWYATMRS